jgi:hypothetical protein
MYRNLEFFFLLLAIENLKKSLQFSISNVEEISRENSPVNKMLVSSNTYCDRRGGIPLSGRRKLRTLVKIVTVPNAVSDVVEDVHKCVQRIKYGKVCENQKKY